MAIEIKLYQFSKKENSTKRPASEDLKGTFQCRLISPTSITAPSVELSLPSTFSVKYVNYAYVQDFDRYYWISGWTYSAGLWIASMTVDALASWKNGISRSGQYVTRATRRANPAITDEMFPATNEVECGRLFNNFETDSTMGAIPNLNSGMYVLSVINNLNEDVTEKNLVTYYAMTQEQYIKFANIIMASEWWTQVLNGTLEYTKYLLSLRWYPYKPRNMDSVGDLRPNIVVGDIPLTGASAYQILRADITVEYNFTFSNIPEHPQKSVHREYLNYEPYSFFNIYWPPVGTIPIDSRKIGTARGLRMTMYTDLRTGTAYYTVASANGWIITTGSCTPSCELPLSSNSIDLGNIASGLSQAGGGIVGMAMTQTYMGAASSAGKIAEGIGNAITSMLPENQSSGASGNVAALCALPYLLYTFHKIVGTTETFGFPLCEYIPALSVLQEDPGNINGYIQTPNPVLQLDCTPGELAEIKSYMIGGFYLE